MCAMDVNIEYYTLKVFFLMFFFKSVESSKYCSHTPYRKRLRTQPPEKGYALNPCLKPDTIPSGLGQVHPGELFLSQEVMTVSYSSI